MIKSIMEENHCLYIVEKYLNSKRQKIISYYIDLLIHYFIN